MAYQDEEQVRGLFDDFISNLVALIEAKDQFLKGHCSRVARYAKVLTKALDLPPKKAREISIAALLHDAGYIAIREPIFQKSEQLSHREFELIQAHPVSGQTILAGLGFNEHILACVRHHHDYFDGNGYPGTVSGDQIPLGARIIYLAEVLDGMTSSRAHRKAFTMEQALEEISMQAGKKFDSRLVNLLIELMKREREAKVESDHGQESDVQKQQILQEILHEIMADCKSEKIELPVLPGVVQHIQSVLLNSETSLKQVAAVVNKDFKISTMLVTLANSAYYRGIREIESVEHAISRLGFTETMKLITVIANRSLYACDDKQYHHLMAQFWKHNLACAYLAHFLARQLHLQNPEEYFSLGLTHDIGKGVLLNALIRKIKEKQLAASFETTDIIAVIDKMHTSFGAVLLRKWKLSEQHVFIAKNHEITSGQDDAPLPLKIIQLANLLTREVDCRPDPGPDEEQIISDLMSDLLLPPQAIDLIVQRTNEVVNQVPLDL